MVVTDLNCDDAVRLSCRMAEENGWYLIQDTAWEGYTEIPLWIMQGYMTMCVEAVNQMALTGLRPTHVFVQVGVGALAGAVVGYLCSTNSAITRLGSILLFFNTEGATDPENHREIVWHGKYPSLFFEGRHRVLVRSCL